MIPSHGSGQNADRPVRQGIALPPLFQRRPKPPMPIAITESSEKIPFRNQVIACPKCKQEMKRKHLAKHKREVHKAPAPLVLHTRSCERSPAPGACSGCGMQNQQTWTFSTSSRGKLGLCASCKKKHLRDSFSPEAMEKKRLAGLKESLRELKELQKVHGQDAFHQNIQGEIAELERLIRTPFNPVRSWSPVLPGSFGSGKRR
jgi:hypothetical protein